mmetsp:Transcript_43677/g.61386  ORF Transcript_43677/g.61386 Transcript_43677/m.61386 type:complete len:135 (+) Transcript_43677:895-1299(+)
MAISKGIRVFKFSQEHPLGFHHLSNIFRLWGNLLCYLVTRGFEQFTYLLSHPGLTVLVLRRNVVARDRIHSVRSLAAGVTARELLVNQTASLAKGPGECVTFDISRSRAGSDGARNHFVNQESNLGKGKSTNRV